MATDLYKTVLYNDGEGATFGDQNDSQRFLAARLNDQVLEKLIGSPTNNDPEFGSQKGANAATIWAYCLDVGQANPKQGSANNKVKLGAGTLFQKIANADGNEPSLLAYTFDGTDEFTLANGDATNPRVDMLQMKLEYLLTDSQSRDFEDGTTHVLSTQSMNKKRVVKCTLSIKQGTPAATPAYPSPDTGNVPIACIVVGATYTGTNPFNYVDTAGAEAVLHDLRMPVCIKPYATLGSDRSFEPNTELIPIPNLLSTDNPAGAPGATHTRSLGKWLIAASAVPIYYPIPEVENGDVITHWQIDYYKNTSGTCTNAGKLVYATHAGETAASTGITDNSNSTGNTAFGEDTSTVVSNVRQYYIKFTPGNSITPAADELGTAQVRIKRLGSDASIVVSCRPVMGRLIALSMTTDSGATTANTSRLAMYQSGSGVGGAGTFSYLADVSSKVNTTANATKKLMTMANLESNAKFIAGPTITGNGTHNPPVWANGKRCYEEAMNIGSASTTPYHIVVRYEFPTTGVNVSETTFYIAEGV